MIRCYSSLQLKLATISRKRDMGSSFVCLNCKMWPRNLETGTICIVSHYQIISLSQADCCVRVVTFVQYSHTEQWMEYSGHCLPSAPHPAPTFTFPLLVSRSLVIFLTWHPVWWLLMWAGQCLTSITLVTDTMPHHHMHHPGPGTLTPGTRMQCQ